MKILELVIYSAGVDGVWARVKKEAELLAANGHEVRVFSSDFIKGSKGRAPHEETMGKVKITRFNGKKLGGESFMSWGKADLSRAIEDYHPDVILAHSYRHPHTVIASRTAKRIGAKSFLITHAPFVPGDKTRSFLAKWYIRWYHDPFVGRSTLKRFDKVIAITQWEKPYLHKLGVPESKIIHIPNGIPDEFFTQKKNAAQHKILFLGRIAPIKNIEVLIKAIPYIHDKKIKVELVGPAEEEYLKKLKTLVQKEGVGSRVVFSGPVNDMKKKIQKIDSASIFVLPSLREAMPQALIEAMARGKTVIASRNDGTLEIIQDGQNGLLFDKDSPQDLAKKINFLQENKVSMERKAKASVEQYRWSKIIAKMERVL